MKERLVGFGCVSGACLSVLALSTVIAHSQGGVKNLIFLQPNTPGITQSGHSNISGTMRASQVHADYAGTGLGSSAVRGESTAATAFVYGVFGSIASTQGRGVFGYASSSTGTNYGVYGRSLSPDGSGVYGQSGSGTGIGVMGESTSNAGMYGISDSDDGVHGTTISASGVRGESTGTTGLTYGVIGTTASTSGRAVYGVATATTGTTRGLYGFVSSSGGRAIEGLAAASSGTTYGVYGDSNSSSGYGVAGFSSFIAIFGSTNGSSGIGLRGFASSATGATRGVEGEVSSVTGTGVVGHALATSGSSTGVLGQTNSAIGTGVKGISPGTSGNLDNAGVFGLNTGFGRGVLGIAEDSGGVGVYGKGSIAFEGQGSASGILVFGQILGARGVAQLQTGTSVPRGLEGVAYHPEGIGVFGEITAIAGVVSNVGYGLYGLIERPTDRGVIGDSDATSGTPYGVFGDTDGVGWAVYASGNSGGSGTKSFRIDHPLDPENSYLIHYASESPEPMNFYSGNVTTDGKGYAWVLLPDYFESINRDFRYQLTVIDESDDFIQVKVSKPIKDGRFQVRTSKPTVAVSWRIEAVRNDAYVRHYPPQSESPKPDHERGLFEHPELYGYGKERSFKHDQPVFKARLRTSDAQLRGKGK